MPKYILRNAHIIADNTHEFLDGAILLEDDRIVDVYPQDSKIKKDVSEYQPIMLDGLIVMPGFFDVRTNQKPTSLATTSYILTSQSAKPEDQGMIGFDMTLVNGASIGIREIVAQKPLSITIAPESLSEDDIQLIKDSGIKLLLGASEYLGDEHDGYYDLFDPINKPLSIKGDSPMNKALSDERYKELCLSGVSDDVICLALNNIARSRIMLCTRDNSESLGDYAKKLYALRYSYTDILAMTSLNGFRFYGLDRRYGSIAKGKVADLLIMNDELELVNAYAKGELAHD